MTKLSGAIFLGSSLPVPKAQNKKKKQNTRKKTKQKTKYTEKNKTKYWKHIKL